MTTDFVSIPAAICGMTSLEIPLLLPISMLLVMTLLSFIPLATPLRRRINIIYMWSLSLMENIGPQDYPGGILIGTFQPPVPLDILTPSLLVLLATMFTGHRGILVPQMKQ